MNVPFTAVEPLDRHYWLARSVARVIGVDPTRAMARGRIDSDTYAEMIATCRNGNCSAICLHWLGDPASDRSRAPQGCAIAETLERLR